MFRKNAGFWLGIAAFAGILLLPLPDGMRPEAHRAAAVAALMAVWWMTEAVEMAAVSIVPLAAYPLLSILSAEETARRYADPNIFLFMGGFMLALAMQKCQLHRRISLAVIVAAGGGRRRILGGFMAATAAISMWVSNTATAVMILPIGMAVVARAGGRDRRFATALMLGIAYAASIGGVATIIGSPPNMIFAGQAKSLFPDLPPVDFMTWSLWAFPLAAGFLAITWAYLALGVPAGGDEAREVVRREWSALGPLSPAETRVMAIFALTVAAWVFRDAWSGTLGLKGLHDGTIAMAAAALLFIVPAGKGDPLLDWEWAKRLPWEVLLLFGGGFALAESFHKTGLAEWLAGGFTHLKGVPLPVLVAALALVTTFSSELMSNTAQVTLMMPVLAAAAPTLGVHPFLLMIPATVAASFAFMMPVGTPPNAIAFASGHVTMPEMARAGFVLNLAATAWITLLTFTLVRAVTGI